jgi:hypothetical protein
MIQNLITLKIVQTKYPVGTVVESIHEHNKTYTISEDTEFYDGVEDCIYCNHPSNKEKFWLYEGGVWADIKAGFKYNPNDQDAICASCMTHFSTNTDTCEGCRCKEATEMFYEEQESDLEYAKRMYPIGTRFKMTINSDVAEVIENNHHLISTGHVLVKCDNNLHMPLNLNNIWAEIIKDESSVPPLIPGDIITVRNTNKVFEVATLINKDKDVIIKTCGSGVISIPTNTCKQVAHVNDFVKGQWYKDQHGNMCKLINFIHSKTGELKFNFEDARKVLPDGYYKGAWLLSNFLPVTMCNKSMCETTITTGNGLYDQIYAADIKPYEGTITTEHLREAASYIYADSDTQELKRAQLSYNLCQNQIETLLQEELVREFSKGIDRIPSEFKEKKKRGSEKIEIFL